MCIFSVVTSHGSAGDEDYVELKKNITLQPGETGPIPITIPIKDDLLVENTEAFTVALQTSSPVLLGKPTTVNIMDNDGKLTRQGLNSNNSTAYHFNRSKK